MELVKEGFSHSKWKNIHSIRGKLNKWVNAYKFLTDEKFLYHTKSCHEYISCELKKLHFLKQQSPGPAYLRSSTAFWINCRSRWRHPDDCSQLTWGKEENKARFSTVASQRSLQVTIVKLKSLEGCFFMGQLDWHPCFRKSYDF